MLNLRTEALRRGPVFQVDGHTKISFRPYNDSRSGSVSGSRSGTSALRPGIVQHATSFSEQEDPQTFEASIIGNLGAPLTIWTDDDGTGVPSDDSPYVDNMKDDMEMQTRSRGQQVSVKVQVEEEVVVESGNERPAPAALSLELVRNASVAHAPLRFEPKPPSSYGNMRRPWTAPPTWRLNRERQRGLMQDIYRVS